MMAITPSLKSIRPITAAATLSLLMATISIGSRELRGDDPPERKTEGPIRKSNETYEANLEADRQAIEEINKSVRETAAEFSLDDFESRVLVHMDRIAKILETWALQDGHQVLADNINHLYRCSKNLLRDRAAETAKFKRQLVDALKTITALRKTITDLRGAIKLDKSPNSLPPLTNAEVKIFNLAHAAPTDLAKVIDSMFSPAQLRLSIDDRTKSLVVMGDKESLGIVEALLMKMDQPADGGADAPLQQGAKRQAEGDRSLLLRVFWLADGLPADEGQDPAAYLPKSVLKALDGLGLKAPRLVTQSAQSVAVGTNDQTHAFTAHVPALVNSQPANLKFSGYTLRSVDERATLNIDISISGSVQCELEGSLATPLGHYMVLGTTNSLSTDQAATGLGDPDATGRGGFVPEGGIRPYDPALRPKAKKKPDFNEARFAFVVQVIEATSYPAEKSE